MFFLTTLLLSSLSANATPTIGAPDGTVYEVVSTKTVYKPAPFECGYNDISVPNQGRYERQQRRYTTYVNGTRIKSWMKTQDVFVECHLI